MVGSQCKTSLRSKNNHPPRKSYHCLTHHYHVYGETSTLGYPLAGLSDAFYCLWVISFVVAIGYLRYVIRHKYDIPAQCCTCDQDGVVDDCCCAFWCGCCATAQIARKLRRPLYAFDATRHSPRRPRVRHPRDRHRQVRLLLGDRRTLNSALERSHIKKVTLHKKLVPGRARQPQPQRVHGGALPYTMIFPDDHRPRQRPLDGASM